MCEFVGACAVIITYEYAFFKSSRLLGRIPGEKGVGLHTAAPPEQLMEEPFECVHKKTSQALSEGCVQLRVSPVSASAGGLTIRWESKEDDSYYSCLQILSHFGKISQYSADFILCCIGRLQVSLINSTVGVAPSSVFRRLSRTFTAFGCSCAA